MAGHRQRKLDIDRFLLFLVRPETKEDTALALAGTEWYRAYRRERFNKVPGSAESARGTLPMYVESFFGSRWEPNVDLVMALQCEDAGLARSRPSAARPQSEAALARRDKAPRSTP